MNGQDFSRIITEAFTPFLRELRFLPRPVKISGRAYQAEFVGEKYTVSISFEPGDDYFLAMVIENGFNDPESIDNREKTPRLSDLNTRYMRLIDATEREANEAYFAHVAVRHSFERHLLKIAKELRLVLPHYLAS